MTTSEQRDIGGTLTDVQPSVDQIGSGPGQATGLFVGRAGDSAGDGPVFQEGQRTDYPRR